MKYCISSRQEKEYLEKADGSKEKYKIIFFICQQKIKTSCLPFHRNGNKSNA